MDKDQPLHMLLYWVEDKGLETAFKDYYPKLAKRDPVLRDYLHLFYRAKHEILARVVDLTALATEYRESKDD